MVAIAPIGAFPTLTQTAALQDLSRRLEQIARQRLGLPPTFDAVPVLDAADQVEVSPEARALAGGEATATPAAPGPGVNATLFPQIFAQPFDTTGFPVRLRLAIADAVGPLQFGATPPIQLNTTAEAALDIAEQGPGALLEETVETTLPAPAEALAPETPAAAIAPAPAAETPGADPLANAANFTAEDVTRQQAAGAAILAGEYGLVASQIEDQYARGEGSDLLVQNEIGGVPEVQPYPDINAYRPDLVEPTVQYLTAEAVIEARHAEPGFETASAETRTAAAGTAPGVTARQAVAAYTAG